MPEAVGVEEEGFGEVVWWVELEELVGYPAEERFEGLDVVFQLGGWAFGGVFFARFIPRCNVPLPGRLDLEAAAVDFAFEIFLEEWNCVFDEEDSECADLVVGDVL